MRTLVFDIETRPNLVWTWGVWQQNIQPAQIVEPKGMISFAAKWHGNPWPTMFHSTGRTAASHKRMIKKLWALLDEADVVVHYNGKKFDIPHANSEFLALGMKPPSPYYQVDLLHTMRRKFNEPHNKLDSVARTVLAKEKIEHEGFGLWLKCMNHDSDAWARMEAYNIHDVELTDELYTELKPWIDVHPNAAAFALDNDICPKCAAPSLRANGWRTTKTMTYQRYVCKACGSYCRSAHGHRATNITT